MTDSRAGVVPPTERERAAKALLRAALVELATCADDLLHARDVRQDLDALSIRLARAYERLRRVPERIGGREQASALADALFTCLTAVRSGLMEADMRAHVRRKLGAARTWLEARL